MAACRTAQDSTAGEVSTEKAQEAPGSADLPHVINWTEQDTTKRRDPGQAYLRAAQAAALLHVSPKTISRWARDGKLGHVVTLGGHRRYLRDDIEGLAGRLAVEARIEV
jgi:excisionase family DNA binding protein